MFSHKKSQLDFAFIDQPLFFTLVFPGLSSKWILFPHAADKTSLTSGWNVISVVCVGGFSAAAVDVGVEQETKVCSTCKPAVLAVVALKCTGARRKGGWKY